MIQPPEPKETTVEEIEKKHNQLQKDFNGFAEELSASMKKFSLKQKALIKFSTDGMFPYISVAPYDWSTEKYLTEAKEEDYKGFSEELKAMMRKYNLRQRPVLNRGNDGGLYPDLTVYRFDWAAEDERAQAEAEVDVITKQESESDENKKSTGEEKAAEVKKTKAKRLPKKK